MTYDSFAEKKRLDGTRFSVVNISWVAYPLRFSKDGPLSFLFFHCPLQF
jgi:hypothetical protein